MVKEIMGRLPDRVPLVPSNYDALCEELNVPYIDIIHGVRVVRGEDENDEV